MASINWNDIPDTSVQIEKGEYILACTESKLITTSNGFKAVQFTWERVGSPKFKVNFDNACYGTQEKDFDFDSKAVSFGCAKLKKINEATVNLDSLDPAILVKAMPGKIIKAQIKVNDKGYAEIDGTNIEKATEAEIQEARGTNTATPNSFTVDANSTTDMFKM